MSPPDKPTPEGKWVEGIGAEQPLRKAAHRILEARLFAVWHWLPLAAEKSDEDIEYVHQLRVSTRRAVEAVRVFSHLIPKSACQDLRDKLCQVRRTADEARNLDVLCAEFVRCNDSCEDTCRRIAEAVRERRQDAQKPIIAIHGELVAAEFGGQITEILEQVNRKGKRNAKATFRRQAPRYLKPVLGKFFKTAEQGLSEDEALHRLRICTKKLRYTMEIVEVAFKPWFRKRLYPQISALQDAMGVVNDHATAKAFFREWMLKTDDAVQQAFLQGVLLAETRAHEDVRQLFLAIWTAKAIRKLQRQFDDCCGLS